MRSQLVLVGMVTLAACKGGGTESIGSTAPPVGSGTSVGSGSSGNTSTSSFENPTEKRTYSAIGGAHSYQYSVSSRFGGVQRNQLYQGDASTARDSGITVAYDPRDAIFEVKVVNPNGGVNQTLRFQDPIHRTAFGGNRQPQIGTPEIDGKGILYLQAGGNSGPIVTDSTGTFAVAQATATRDVSTFFYQKPGTSTRYVTFAGYVRNASRVTEVTGDTPDDTYLRTDLNLERAAFAYGQRTDNDAVPKSGTGTYSGDMLATMIYNPRPDTNSPADSSSYFQWINGTAAVNVNFATNAVTTEMTGTVLAPQSDIFTNLQHSMPAGATFAAKGSATIDLVRSGGFVGQIGEASFTNAGVKTDVNIAGSSVDGAFYGPRAEEVGGGFRIVGGTPDQRIDILGTFTGAK